MAASNLSQQRLRRFDNGDRRVVVAMLDGPVALSHPCLRGAHLRPLQSLVSTHPTNGVATAHGTHVASVLFGQLGTSVEGIVPQCAGLAIPVFSDYRDRLACSQLDLARAITLAVEHGAHIINISGGQLSKHGEAEDMLAKAIELCAQRNVLVVAAAGNDGCDCLHVPASIATVLAVGAMDASGRPLASSNWGQEYLKQGLLAPGVAIRGAALPDGVVERTGTSFAAPFVSGVAALLIAKQLSLGQAPDPHAVRAVLLASASACIEGEEDCRRVLGGRIDVEAAFAMITGGVQQVSDTLLISTSENAAPDEPRAYFPRDTHNSPPPLRMGTPRVSAEPGIHMSEDFGGSRSPQAPGSEDLVPSGQPPLSLRAGSVLPSCGGDGACSCGGAKAGGCNCGCGGHGNETQKPQLVYALGTIGIEFANEASHDSFIQAMEGGNPFDHQQLVAFLEKKPYEASSLIWTLNIDTTPIYAIHPMGAYAEYAYEQMRKCLLAQLAKDIHHADIASIPGIINGQTRLMSGQVVPVVVPALRGIYAWNVDALIKHVYGTPPKNAEERKSYDRHATTLGDFLSRVYFELRNLGLSGPDRALNFAATDASRVAAVIEKATKLNLELDRLSVTRSPICRPESECYDVELSFFNSSNMNIANRVFRFTVDVSDVIPVSLHQVRDWAKRA